MNCCRDNRTGDNGGIMLRHTAKVMTFPRPNRSYQTPLPKLTKQQRERREAQERQERKTAKREITLQPTPRQEKP